MPKEPQSNIGSADLNTMAPVDVANTLLAGSAGSEEAARLVLNSNTITVAEKVQSNEPVVIRKPLPPR